MSVHSTRVLVVVVVVVPAGRIVLGTTTLEEAQLKNTSTTGRYKLQVLYRIICDVPTVPGTVLVLYLYLHRRSFIHMNEFAV